MSYSDDGGSDFGYESDYDSSMAYRLRNKPLSKEALQRLMRDWKEVQNEPLSSVSAKPLENDLSQWHCTLCPSDGPYAGVAFHLVLQVPFDYPKSPPRVHLSTKLPHPNVFGSGICLDMIKLPAYSSRPYQGWSTAYSIQSVLLQLQSFLFAENVPQGYGRDVNSTLMYTDADRESAIEEARAFHCHLCGFPDQDKHSSQDEQAPNVSNGIPLTALDSDMLVLIMDALDARSLSALVRTCKTFVQLATRYGLWVRRELVCFQSKVGFSEDVLGFGLTIEGPTPNPRGLGSAYNDQGRGGYHNQGAQWHGGNNGPQYRGHYYAPQYAGNHGRGGHHAVYNNPHQRRASGPQSAKGPVKWKGSMQMDYISSTAFFDLGVRKGVWNEGFTWWLPLLLDEGHARRAMPLLKCVLSALAANPLGTPPRTKEELMTVAFRPGDVFQVLPRLMNSMVLSFVYKKDNESGSVDLHASEKALLGYCQLHHMFLQLAKEYPGEIQYSVDHAVADFRSDPAARVKERTHDLGELLVLLSVASPGAGDWGSIADVFLEETFDRNVLWLLKEHPEISKTDVTQQHASSRLRKSFEGTATSRQLIMFQVAFLLLARPAGSSPAEILAFYSQRYGYPRPGLTRQLQSQWYKIRECSSWGDFFSALGMARPSDGEVLGRLRRAVHNSIQKGYHTDQVVRQAEKRIRTESEGEQRAPWGQYRRYY